MNLIKTKKFIAGVFLIALCNKHDGAAPYVEDHNLSNFVVARSKVQSITGYQFRNCKILQHVFRHPSLDSKSKFRELEFLGDKVISAIIAMSTFDLTKRVENLQHDFVEKTSNDYLAKISLELGLLHLVPHNPSSRSESIAADAFEALVGAMQLDSEQHPHQISPAAIRFVLEAFNMQTSQQLSLQNTRDLTLREPRQVNESRQSFYENADQNRDIGLVGVAIAGVVGAGIGALWNWLSGSPDYKKMYEECRIKKNIYKGLCVVMGSMLCWPYISPYFWFMNTDPKA